MPGLNAVPGTPHPQWVECPVEKCGPLGVPIGTTERWYGPRDANLFCPACGHGWVGSRAEVAQAIRAEEAWEERELQQARQAAEREKYREVTGKEPPAVVPEAPRPEPVLGCQLDMFGKGPR